MLVTWRSETVLVCSQAGWIRVPHTLLIQCAKWLEGACVAYIERDFLMQNQTRQTYLVNPPFGKWVTWDKVSLLHASFSFSVMLASEDGLKGHMNDCKL